MNQPGWEHMSRCNIDVTVAGFPMTLQCQPLRCKGCLRIGVPGDILLFHKLLQQYVKDEFEMWYRNTSHLYICPTNQILIRNGFQQFNQEPLTFPEDYLLNPLSVSELRYSMEPILK